eukprot:629397-Prymnesium_polylepis.1
MASTSSPSPSTRGRAPTCATSAAPPLSSCGGAPRPRTSGPRRFGGTATTSVAADGAQPSPAAFVGAVARVCATVGCAPKVFAFVRGRGREPEACARRAVPAHLRWLARAEARTFPKVRCHCVDREKAWTVGALHLLVATRSPVCSLVRTSLDWQPGHRGTRYRSRWSRSLVTCAPCHTPQAQPVLARICARDVRVCAH